MDSKPIIHSQYSKLKQYLNKVVTLCGDHPHAGKEGVVREEIVEGPAVVVDLVGGGNCYVYQAEQLS